MSRRETHFFGINILAALVIKRTLQRKGEKRIERRVRKKKSMVSDQKKTVR
jgi:hypothetical protein